MIDPHQRFSRQARLPGYGAEAQMRLRDARVLVAGCGALGTVVCDYLARAGVGQLTVVDRDVVEWSNLQRQSLFTEQDARRSVPKAEAAKARLGVVNGACTVRAFVDDLQAGNALDYASEADLIVDCLDNFETRATLNECAVARRVPLVYGGAVGFEGMVAAILPHAADPATPFGGGIRWSAWRETACMRCLLPELPAPGEVPTCDVAGVLGPVAGVVASIEAALAIRMIAEGPDAVPDALVRVDLRSMRVASSALASARDPACPVCSARRFERLCGAEGAEPFRVICGRDAVEVVLAGSMDDASLARIEDRIRGIGAVVREQHGGTRVLRIELGSDGCSEGPTRISVLAGVSRTLALVEGTRDPERARAAVARWIGV